jgi:arylsulfatase A-like enzyme
MNKSLWFLIAACALLASASAFNGCSQSQPDAIFLIVVDTLRPDRLSCYGYEAHETPNIDKIAKDGVLFRNARAVGSWTAPSMGAIMTSLYPSQLGIIENPAPSDRSYEVRERREQVRLKPSLGTRVLGEIMSDAGLRTAAFIDQPVLNLRDGFVQGIEDWYYPIGKGIKQHDTRVPSGPKRKSSWVLATGLDSALVDELDLWLERKSDEKLFAWLHLLTPHRPYAPPKPFAPPQNGAGTLEATPSELYDGEVRYADYLIGRVLDSIERHVGFKRAMIVFTSDHGEAFGEHGMEEHGHSLHDEVIHVPLIIKSPLLPRSRTIDSFVSTIDILPTILDVAGLQSFLPGDAEGTSLVPMINGESVELPVYAEGMLYGTTERCYITNDKKLMFDQYGDQYTLFDLSMDRAEMRDVAGHEPDWAEKLKGVMAVVHNRLQNDYVLRQSQEPEDVSTAADAEERLRALRALGYVND